MSPYQLRPLVREGLAVAVAENTSRFDYNYAYDEPPSPRRPDDEYIPARIVDDHTYEDLAEVELNYSFIERLMGPASARTIRQVRRLTVTAFGLCGATAVHKLMRQQAGTNSRDPWPWESAMMGRRSSQHNLLLSSKSGEGGDPFLLVLAVVLLLAVAAGLAFLKLTSPAGGSTLHTGL